MTEKIEVKIGQIWADNDKRFWIDDLVPSRFVRVEELVEKAGKPAARVVLVEWDRLSNEWVVKCRPSENPRYSTIALRRFRPNATGYRLWEDV